MKLFGRNHRKHREDGASGEGSETGANKTAPGLKAIKDLWDIAPKKRVERVEGEVVTDIYATPRPNGVPPRRKYQNRRRPDADGEFIPPY
jgi:hypothetical protein